MAWCRGAFWSSTINSLLGRSKWPRCRPNYSSSVQALDKLEEKAVWSFQRKERAHTSTNRRNTPGQYPASVVQMLELHVSPGAAATSNISRMRMAVPSESPSTRLAPLEISWSKYVLSLSVQEHVATVCNCDHEIFGHQVM